MSSLRRQILWGGLAAVGVCIIGTAAWTKIPSPSIPLAIYAHVPAFTLIDQAGRPVSREDLLGKVWIADFIFTRCAGQCPMMSDEMARLAATFRTHGSVKLISFTVDPDWDTPEVLARYAKRYGAASEQWHFVTGDKEELWRVCQEGFRLAVAADGGTVEEPITHSVRFVLVDREGNIRGYYDATDSAAMKQLHHDLRRLLQKAS